ncbi:MAG: SIMPL domain-containing protein [Chloroflexia bacterium]|nr:SIMPL domain-containing protein [Chloroflexia bacterium]
MSKNVGSRFSLIPALRPRLVGPMAAVVLIGATLMSSSPIRHAGAQNATPEAGAMPATVSVTGMGIVRIEPDTASISVGVTATQPNLSEAQAQATDIMTAIIAALTDAGVAEPDIQTSNYNVNVLQNYDPQGLPTDIQGYQVSNQVNVIVRDLDTLGNLLDAAVGAGANTIYGISFYVEDTREAASQARVQAVEDARAKADDLAAAAGMSVSRVLSINEGSSPSPTPEVFQRAGMGATDMSSVPIQTGTSDVVVQVSITYEMR